MDFFLLASSLSISFHSLPLPEKLSIIAYLSLLLLFFFVYAFRVLSCADNTLCSRFLSFKNGGARPVLACADPDNGSRDKLIFVVGFWFNAALYSSFYVLFLQIIVLGYETARICNSVLKDYSFLCLSCVEAMVFLAIVFSAFQIRFRLSKKFPFLLRLCWFGSFCLCLYIGYADTRGFLDKHTHLNSHLVANYAAAPALAFLSIAAFRGVSGIEVYRENHGLREPLLAEEEEDGCLKVTLYNQAGFFSLATVLSQPSSFHWCKEAS